MLQAAICMLIGIAFGIYTTQYAAVFDQSAGLLMPLDQLETRIKSVAESAKYNQGDLNGTQIVTDWDQRMDRFKKHINILKNEPAFASIMESLGKEGFERVYPHEYALILNILGLKPITCGFVPSVHGLILKAHDLIVNCKLVDMALESNGIITTKPIIPFALILNDYFNSSTWKLGTWKDNGQPISINLLSNFDQVLDQSQYLMALAQKHGDFGSPQDLIDRSNGQAMLLGLQPNAKEMPFYTEQYLQVLHLYLGLIPPDTLSELDQEIWKRSFANSAKEPLNRYTSDDEDLAKRRFYIKDGEIKSIEGKAYKDILTNVSNAHLRIEATKNFNNRQARLTAVSQFIKQGDISKEALTFAGNIKNYRLSLYTGTRAYNDYSSYVQLLGLLLEFFFRSAFGDQAYLEILYNKIAREIKELADFLGQFIEWSDFVFGKELDNRDKQGLAQPQLFKTWQAFYDSRTGANKDNLTDDEKNSFPPFKETFKQFLTKIFGVDTWSWNDDTDFSFQFDETQKDLILKRFLERAEPKKDLLAGQLDALKYRLSNLKDKLDQLKKKLKKLREKLG